MQLERNTNLPLPHRVTHSIRSIVFTHCAAHLAAIIHKSASAHMRMNNIAELKENGMRACAIE
jgi:hypothetical protein